MPSWKKVVASGSDASFSSATVDTFVSASSFKGSFTGSLFGTASQAISSSYALTASYLLGYISPFPFTGSAQITGSLGVTGSLSVTGNTGGAVFSSNADTLLITGSLIITGSGASITGSLNVSNGITSSLFGTSSQAVSSSYAYTASSAISASFAVNYLGSGSISTRLTNLETASGSFSTRVTNTETTSSNLVAASSSLSTRVTQIERTYATTGSNIFTGSQNILGAITASAALINGTLTAQTLVVTTVSSSVIYSSGSNRFGDDTSDIQTFTGSVNISGSLTLIGRGTINNLTGSLFGTSSWSSGSISASYAYTASSATNAFQAISSSYAFTASSAISASNALTASYVPASAVVGLNLSQIATGSVTASVGLTTASFQLVSGSTTLLYVSNSGNLGLGTTDPLGRLHVSTGTSGSCYVIIEADTDNNSETDVPQLWFKADGGINEASVGLNDNTLDLVSNVGSANGIRFLIGSTNNSGSTSPYIGATERMRISTTGASITGSLNVSAGITGSLSGSVTGSLFGTASQATSASYAFTASSAISSSYAFTASSATNAFSSSFALTASYVNPLRQNVIISGSLTVSASATALSIQGSGSNVFSVDGTSGRLFEVDDSLSGSLFSVNTAAGLPVIEAFSDNTVRIGQFGQRALFVSQSRVGVGTETPTTNLDVSGSGRYTNGLSLTGSVNSLNGYTGSLFGTASWAQNALTASFAMGGSASSILYQTASAAFTWSFNHFLQTQYPVFTIYDSSNNVIVPQRIQAVDTSSALIYFSSPTTGVAVASKGGYSSSVVTSAIIANTAITASFALSGTGTFSGSFSGSYQGNFSGSYFGTSSQAVSASYAFTASSASTAFSASYAQTSSFANNFTVANQLTAQTLVVSTISSSVVYSSGSNIFGNSLSNTQTFTGSVGITGSLTLRGNQLISGSLIFTTASTYTPSYDLEIPQSAKNNGIAQIYGAGTTWTLSAIATISRNGTGNQSMLSMLMGGTSSTTKQVPLAITGSWNQSGTAGYTILEVAAIENTIGTGPKLLQDWVINGVSKASINNVGTLRLSGSANITGSLSISGSLLLNQSTSSLGISTQTVSTNATSSYTSVFYNYTLASGSNARAGQVIAVWSGSAIQYMDNSTTDIGNTALVALTASLSAGNVLLTTVLPTAGWTVKTLVNLL